MVVEAEAASVELTIPCKPEFVGVARLALLGVASRMGFTYDQVEDIRVAVGEACTISVDWAERNGRAEAVISLRTQILPDRLVIDVRDTAGPRSPSAQSEQHTEEEDLGALLIELLVDEMEVEHSDQGTRTRMVKLAAENAG